MGLTASLICLPVKAGPPLAIDDPGVLDIGQWEIIAAAAWAKADEGRALESPIADISLGISENIQISAAMSYVWVNQDDSGSDSDWGNPEVGVKWRFVNSERLQVAVAPAYTFGTSINNATRGISDDEDTAFIPVNFELDLGNDWTLNGEVGYASVKNETDAWAYGAAIGHPFGQRTQLLFEIYGGADTDWDDNFLNFHVGADIELTEQLHTLFSIGSNLTRSDEAEDLDLDVFLGLQYFTK